MKTIGVIGGFGPEATARFYLELVHALNTLPNNQPHIIMRHCSVPGKLLEDTLLHGKNVEKFIPFLIQSAKKLEKAGADVVVLPCGTLHVLADAIQSSIHIPFVSIIDATVRELQKTGVKRVGLLGTSVTCRNNLFARKDPTIIFTIPEQSIQKKLDCGVHCFVTTGNDQQLKHALHYAVLSFQSKGIRDILIACTDFHGLYPKRNTITFHDVLDILINATVQNLREAK